MDKLTLYFDRNFGKRIPYALSRMNPPMEIRWHDGERFPQNMPDDQWLEIAGKNNWIVLTQDLKFHLIDHEIAAVRQHQVGCFYFPSSNYGIWKTTCAFIRFHQRVLALASEVPRPFIFEFKGTGKLVTVLAPANENR